MIESYYVVEFLNGHKPGWQPIVIFLTYPKAEKWIELSVEDGFEEKDHRIVRITTLDTIHEELGVEKDGYYNL